MDIVKQLQAAQTAANKANEQRYQDILGQYDTLGKAGETRIQQNTEQAQAKSTQDLTARGLGNTTITSAASRGIASDAEASRQALTEGITRDKTKVMEAKTEQGPDMSMYANLLAQAGKAQKPATPAAAGGGQTMLPLGPNAAAGRDVFGQKMGGGSGGGGNYTPQAPTPSTNSRTPYGQMEGDYGATTAAALGADGGGAPAGSAASKPATEAPEGAVKYEGRDRYRMKNGQWEIVLPWEL
jgi:hypothetical protein